MVKRIKVCVYILLALLGVSCANEVEFEVTGRSMTPTFNPGDRLAITSGAENLNRWDLVAHYFYHEQVDQDIVTIRRVVGLPGELIVIGEKGIKVNGSYIDTPDALNGFYEPLHGENRVFWRNKEFRLSENEIFVLGDNINKSNDSRRHGAVELSEVVGRVALVSKASEDSRLIGSSVNPVEVDSDPVVRQTLRVDETSELPILRREELVVDPESGELVLDFADEYVANQIILNCPFGVDESVLELALKGSGWEILKTSHHGLRVTLKAQIYDIETVANGLFQIPELLGSSFHVVMEPNYTSQE